MDLVALEPFLRKLPLGVSVPFLEVDAYGFDLDVVISVGNFIQNVGRIILEVQDLPAGDAFVAYVCKSAIEGVYHIEGGRARIFFLENIICYLFISSNSIVREEDCMCVQRRICSGIRRDRWQNHSLHQNRILR